MPKGTNIMISDITIGKYVRKNSVIHHLDGRIKIIGVLLYSIAVLSCENYLSMIITGMFTVVGILISRLQFSYVIKGLKPLRWFILFTAAVNLFSVKGTVLLNISCLNITYEGISAALLLAMRFIFFVLGTSLLTLTTPPVDITDALAKLMSPLKKMKIPTDDIAMIISITLRFIPIFADEATRIIKAQKARGSDFNTGSIASRIRTIIPVTIPLFAGVIKKAEDLSLAMDTRCYGKGLRNSRKKHKFNRNDMIFLLIMIFFCGILAIIEFFN